MPGRSKTKKRPKSLRRVGRAPHIVTGNSTAFKRSDYERERDITLIVALYLKGLYQWEISERLNSDPARGYKINQQMVSNDLREAESRWRSSTIIDFNEAKWKELNRVDELEREAYAAWFRSVGKRTVETTETVQTTAGTPEPKAKPKTREKTIGRARVTIRTEEDAGSADYLRLVAWCIDKRCAILGLLAPMKVAPTSPDGDKPYEIGVELGLEERARRLIGIVTVATRRLETGEKPSIDIEARQVDTTAPKFRK